MESVDDMFEDFGRQAVASTSVVQVHRGRLRDGKETAVAVKVEKPADGMQVNWDSVAYKIVMCGESILLFPEVVYMCLLF